MIVSTLSISVSNAACPLSGNLSNNLLCLRAEAATFASAYTYPTLGVRRAIQYSKGALFMAQLRVTLGDAAFWSGLRRYTRDHAGGTVTSIDLKRAMEEASGRDLRPLFAEWVFGEGLSEGQSQ